MAFDCLNIESLSGFDWDGGNLLKNEIKHNPKWQIIEEVFFNEPLILLEDTNYSNKQECRCVALGLTNEKHLVPVISTQRKNKIRAISTRPMSKKREDFL
ncbi:MAG: hypothetical protein KU28_07225 [Sulfurovum sp. PC08-66]|nr:MAG: hypothetical protein KU28_07225 [Sulfurovum sp. PC08-66]